MALAMEPDYGLNGVGAPFQIRLDRIVRGEEIRSGGLDEAHVRVLVETADQWPAIVVWGEDCLLVDGAHRVEAARRLGRQYILAVPFLGRQDEAYVESIRRNVEHGLPLSVSDRRRAAVRVLAGHADWSDRRIAMMCGLSGKTVARLRRSESADSQGGVVVGLERRVGRDGKARPVQSGEVRDRIKRALEENPTGSLRAIAAMAGASPETVRTVRSGMGGSEGVHAVQQERARRVVPSAADRTQAETLDYFRTIMASGSIGPSVKTWTSDRALMTAEDKGQFAEWFAGNAVGDDWRRYVCSIPIGRVYEVVDEARRRANAWNSFASMLESRTR